MIDLRKTLNEAHQILAEAQVSHALIGGFALASYGHHRATSDIDLLADGTKSDIIRNIFLKNSYKLRFESEEVLQFSGPGHLDILLANRPLSQQMLKQAVLNLDLNIYILRPEDLIGLKIQAYKNDPARALQDKADIQGLLNIKSIDLNLVKKYADIFNEWPEIQKIYKQVLI